MTDLDAVCIEPACKSPATHERTVDVTTALVPAGDPDGFSWVVELVCGEHVEGWPMAAGCGCPCGMCAQGKCGQCWGRGPH